MRVQYSNFTGTFDTGSFPSIDRAEIARRVGAANERVLDVVVDANRRLADVAVKSADRAAEALPGTVPFADKLPTPAESAARYLDFVERAVAVNRDFNQRVVARLTVDAPAPIDTSGDAVVGTVTEPVAPPAPAKKAAAKKAAAKKAAAKKAPVKKATAKKAAVAAAAEPAAAESSAASN